MNISWQYVYEAGQWFWMEPSVIHILGIVEGLLFLWFVCPLKHRCPHLSLNMLEKVCFICVCVYIQLQCYPIVKHCLCFLSLHFFYTLLFRQTKRRNALFISSIFCLITEFAKLLVKDGPIACLASHLLSTDGESIFFNLLLLTLYILLTATEVIAIRKHSIQKGRDGIRTAQIISLVFPLVLYLFVRNLQFYYMGSDAYLWTQLQMVEIFAAGSALIVLITTDHFLSMELERNELLNRETLLRQQQKQFLIRKETIDAVNRKYHDLKHYLAGIEALSSEDTKKYIQAIRREITPYERCQDTGNEVLDILLTDQIRICQEKEIQLVPYIDGRRLGFIHSLDLCSIFGNAMDNAIEATDMLSDPTLREIHVKIGTSDHMVVMHFQNHFEGELHTKDNRLLTRKTDSLYHGYGLENIRILAEKYNGTAAYEVNGQIFTLNVILPLPPKNEEAHL